MRTFEKFPANKECPICNTNENVECVLIPMVDVNHNPSDLNYKAEIFHLKCIELWYDVKLNVLYQKFKKAEVQE